jgi:hypothetical protein
MLVADILTKVKEQHPDYKPVFVVEMASGSSDVFITHTAEQLKYLACDLGLARCILVLPHATSAFALRADRDRQDFLWVGDFSNLEAKNYLEKRSFLAPRKADENELYRAKRADLVDELLQQVGTRPAALRTLLSEVTSPEAAVDYLSQLAAS